MNEPRDEALRGACEVAHLQTKDAKSASREVLEYPSDTWWDGRCGNHEHEIALREIGAQRLNNGVHARPLVVVGGRRIG